MVETTNEDYRTASALARVSGIARLTGGVTADYWYRDVAEVWKY